MPLNSIVDRYRATAPTTTLPRAYSTDGASGDLGGLARTMSARYGATVPSTTIPRPNPNLLAKPAAVTRPASPPPSPYQPGAYQPSMAAAGTAPAAGVPAAGFTSGTANNGTAPMQGWAKGMGYTPGDLLGMNQMPSGYLYDILQNRGMDPTGGLYYMMEPLADILMPLFETIYGAGRDALKPFESNDIANFMGQMFGEMMTPGGRGPDTGELMNLLLGTNDTTSMLGSVLNMGTPEERIQTMQQYAQMIGQLSGSPMNRQALSNQLSARGMDYLDSFRGGNQPTATFGQMLRNPGF